MVNKENMRKWVAALRSGEFQQGKHTLAVDHGNGWRYCCLGVACEVAIRDGLELEVRRYESDGLDGYPPVSKAYGSTDDQGVLPDEVMAWLGITTPDPFMRQFHVFPEQEAITATRANDIEGWGFWQIATAIEDYYGLKGE